MGPLSRITANMRSQPKLVVGGVATWGGAVTDEILQEPRMRGAPEDEAWQDRSAARLVG